MDSRSIADSYMPVFGMMCVIIFTIGWVGGAIAWGHWVLGQNALSDLGVCGNQTAELLFGLGCAFSGIFGLFFGLGMLDEKGLYKTYGAFVILACVSLICIGVVDESYGDLHMYTAGTYAVFALLSIIVSAVAEYVDGRRYMTYIAAVVLIALLIICLTTRFEVFEPIASVIVLAWTFSQAVKFMNLHREWFTFPSIGRS